MVPEVVSGGSIHHVLASSLSELAIVAATRGTGAQLIFRGLFFSWVAACASPLRAAQEKWLFSPPCCFPRLVG